MLLWLVPGEWLGGKCGCVTVALLSVSVCCYQSQRAEVLAHAKVTLESFEKTRADEWSTVLRLRTEAAAAASEAAQKLAV